MTTKLTQRPEKASKVIGLVIALACAMPAVAQTSGTGSQGSAGTSSSTTDRRTDSDFDWGWIGLLGLAGLMGLRRKPDVMDTTRKTSTAR